jgi:MarR family transcriptional regulator, organic hydroperoxide resistance regulator
MNSTTDTRTATQCRQRFDSLEQEVFLNLWRTYDRLRAIEEDVFGRSGLSAQQYNALRLLRSVHPGAMPTLELGSRLISRAPDMTRLLDRLEQRGLLGRQRRPENRRVVQVQITAEGLQLLDDIHEAVLECHRRQLGHLNAKSLRQLAGLLKEARAPHEDADNPSFVDG